MQQKTLRLTDKSKQNYDLIYIILFSCFGLFPIIIVVDTVCRQDLSDLETSVMYSNFPHFRSIYSEGLAQNAPIT